MRDLWSDVKLALILVSFVFLLKWTSDVTGSKKVGIIFALVIAYLTFYSHFNILIFVLILFFGYPFFGEIAEAWKPAEVKEEKK